VLCIYIHLKFSIYSLSGYQWPDPHKCRVRAASLPGWTGAKDGFQQEGELPLHQLLGSHRLLPAEKTSGEKPRSPFCSLCVFSYICTNFTGCLTAVIGFISIVMLHKSNSKTSFHAKCVFIWSKQKQYACLNATAYVFGEIWRSKGRACLSHPLEVCRIEPFPYNFKKFTEC